MTYRGVNFGSAQATLGSSAKLYFNFDTELSDTLYMGERLLMLAEKIGSGTYIEVNVYNQNILARYYYDSDGYALVDLTDVVRAYYNSSILTEVSCEGESATYGVFDNISEFRLINPLSVLIPPHDLDEDEAVIIPPTKFYMKDNTIPVVAECNFSDPLAWQIDGNGTLSGDHATITGAFTLAKDLNTTKDYSPYKLECGKAYALVKWRSFTGVMRTHFFELVKAKTDVADEVALMPIGSEYSVAKGRVDGFSLRLDGLSRYDLWYYSDLLTSGEVYVSLDYAKFDKVQIADNSITLPDGEAKNNGKLQIALNWKHYDAVIL